MFAYLYEFVSIQNFSWYRFTNSRIVSIASREEAELIFISKRSFIMERIYLYIYGRITLLVRNPDRRLIAVSKGELLISYMLRTITK
jgi:hypothetical protein